MDEPDDFIVAAIRRFVFFRLLLAAVAYLVFMCVAVGFIVCWIYKEIALEVRYHHRYGSEWHVEYEKYYGSLSHAHAQIAIAVAGILAIVAVLAFLCYRTLRKHGHARHYKWGTE